MNKALLHTFHIPVMGLAYTIDSPVKVARYGISSVISIIEDNLVELMRQHYYKYIHQPYFPITKKENDYRAKRITDYLNLVNKIVQSQIEKLKISAFETGSEIVNYFEMLPTNSKLRELYGQFRQAINAEKKKELENLLRNSIMPGSIDVNIMTKVDKNNYDKNGNLQEDGSDALAALRGYLNSTLTNSSIIFSAGMNPRLFNYLEKFNELHPKGWGMFDKRVVIKVSDFRSALIQGKYLAKKGIWVSEFRVESGLNCGGHAFASDGYLVGPILQEFKNKKEELANALFDVYKPAAQAKGIVVYDTPHPIKLSVQGGIGTHEEDAFLHDYYNVESTGWGTPFLLCPEATTVDEETLDLLCKAQESDVILSKNSPLGIPFYYLRDTSSEKEKLTRISKGKPGSPCTEKHLVSNTEFTEKPICTASHAYQKKKLATLHSLQLQPKELQEKISEVTTKECLCIGLSNAAIVMYDLPPLRSQKAVTICPGPNIAYFSKIVTLKEITDHIYGRIHLLGKDKRPHMFIKEIALNLHYLKEKLASMDENGDDKQVKSFKNFGYNLLEGISYYRTLVDKLSIDVSWQEKFQQELDKIEEEVYQVVKPLGIYSSLETMN